MSATNKVGRPRKKHRGPEPEIAKSDGDIVGFRNLSVNSKRAYWSEPKGGILTDAPAGSRKSLLLENDLAVDDLVVKPVGRPPLDLSKGPMRQSSLMKRRADLNNEQRKRDHLSEVRRGVVNSRKDRQNQELESEEENQQGTNELNPSERTIRRLKLDFLQVLPPSLGRQVELLVKLVEDGLVPELSLVSQTSVLLQETLRTSFLRCHRKRTKI